MIDYSINAIYALGKPPPLTVVVNDSKILARKNFWELRGLSETS